MHAFLRRQNLTPLLYAINVNIGRPRKREQAITAKDLFSFEYGIDILGNVHIQRPLPEEVRERLKPTETIRILNKDDYGYYRISDTETISKVYPRDTGVKLDLIISGSYNFRKMVARAFNMEQINRECYKIREKVSEHELTNYLNKKKYVQKDDIEKMVKFKKRVTSRKPSEPSFKLEEFL